MSLTTGPNRVLDGEKLFYMWLELGTQPKVHAKLKNDGVVNPNTKKPFSYQGVQVAILRWTIENPEEARAVFNRETGYYPNTPEGDADWRDIMITRAKWIYTSRRKFAAWLTKNGYYDWYYQTENSE